MFGLVKAAVALICAAAAAGHPAPVEPPTGGHLSAGERVTTIGGLAWPGGREYTAVAGDGDIYVAATPRRSGTAAVQVRRYLPDGRLDPSFASDGIAVLGQLAGTHFRLGKLLVDAYGLPYLAGTASSVTVVMRLTADGTLDPSYGGGGIARLDLGPVAAPDPLATIDQQRHIVLAAARVARLTPGGDLDTSFGEGGTVPIPGGEAEDIGADASGRIELTLPDPARDRRAFRLMGLNAAGRPDRSLGPAGVRTFRGIGAARGLAVTRHGIAVVLGTDESRRPRGSAKAEVLRIGSEGGREIHRRVSVPLPRGGTATGVFDDPDGYVYLTGSRFVVVLTEGQVTRGFPFGGKLIVSPPGGLVIRGLSITDGDRKILLDGLIRSRGPKGTAHGFLVEYPAARYEITYTPEPAGP